MSIAYPHLTIAEDETFGNLSSPLFFSLSLLCPLGNSKYPWTPAVFIGRFDSLIVPLLINAFEN